MPNRKLIRIFIFFIITAFPALNAQTPNAELLSKLKMEKDIISAAVESIHMINKSKLVSINSLTSESMIAYDELLKKLNSEKTAVMDRAGLNKLLNSCLDAHKTFIRDSVARIKDNIDLVAELKEMYPDIFRESFCVDSISKYSETLSIIDKYKSNGGDIYDIINMIIISDRAFAFDINDFKSVK